MKLGDKMYRVVIQKDGRGNRCKECNGSGNLNISYKKKFISVECPECHGYGSDESTIGLDIKFESPSLFSLD